MLEQAALERAAAGQLTVTSRGVLGETVYQPADPSTVVTGPDSGLLRPSEISRLGSPRSAESNKHKPAPCWDAETAHSTYLSIEKKREQTKRRNLNVISFINFAHPDERNFSRS